MRAHARERQRETTSASCAQVDCCPSTLQPTPLPHPLQALSLPLSLAQISEVIIFLHADEEYLSHTYPLCLLVTLCQRSCLAISAYTLQTPVQRFRSSGGVSST